MNVLSLTSKNCCCEIQLQNQWGGATVVGGTESTATSYFGLVCPGTDPGDTGVSKSLGWFGKTSLLP